MCRCGCVLCSGRVALRCVVCRGVSRRFLGVWRCVACRGVSLVSGGALRVAAFPCKMLAICAQYVRKMLGCARCSQDARLGAAHKKETLLGLYCRSPSVSHGSLHVFRCLNRSGRCAINAARFRRYLSRQSLRCLTSRADAFSKDSSVNSQRPSTRIAPVGGLPLGRFCGDSAISKGKESAHNRLNDAHCWHGSHCHHRFRVDVSIFSCRRFSLRLRCKRYFFRYTRL